MTSGNRGHETSTNLPSGTLIACVHLPGDALGHSAPFFHRSVCDDPGVGYRTILDARAMVYLAGVTGVIKRPV